MRDFRDAKAMAGTVRGSSPQKPHGRISRRVVTTLVKRPAPASFELARANARSIALDLAFSRRAGLRIVSWKYFS